MADREKGMQKGSWLHLEQKAVVGICKRSRPLCYADADKTGVKLITVNSWNEWTETSYLEPDNVYGYGYLEAVKKVFLEE